MLYLQRGGRDGPVRTEQAEGVLDEDLVTFSFLFILVMMVLCLGLTAF